MVFAEKSDHVVCVFRLDSFDDVEAVGEALKRISWCWISPHVMRSARRIRDFMKGVAYPMQVWIQEMSENILVYLPDGYQDSGIPELVDFAFQSAKISCTIPM